ncbi:MAG: hypothetical protein ACKVT0_12775 [Planctomycetaceae bacterium]
MNCIRFNRQLLFIVAIGLLVVTCDGQPALSQTDIFYPQLRGFKPLALQTGTTAEITVMSSNDLRDISRVIVIGTGVEGEVIPNPPEEIKAGEALKPVLSMKLRMTAAVDALPGPRHVRLLSPRGVSTLAEIVVVRDPVVMEAADNNTLDKAQAIASLPATIYGEIEGKVDVDVYKFHIDRPQSLVFHVWGERLQHTLNDIRGRGCIDAMLTLKSSTGATLAASDNTFGNDPLLHYEFREAGDYVLEIRDVRFHGWGEYWGYAIEIHSRPFVTQVFPLAVTPGQGTTFSLVGYNLPADATAAFTFPEDVPEGKQLIAPLVGDQLSNAFAAIVTRLPIVNEIEADNNAAAVGQVVAYPAAINGRIESPGDVDCYKFAAKKDEKFSFECISRRAGTPLDSYLRVLDEQGQQLAENDDHKYSLFTLADSELEGWTAPQDGNYVVEIRDMVGGGGPSYAYVLNVRKSEPRFLLEANSDKTILAPGINSPIYVRIDRRNGFTGDVELAVEGLPPGVTAECGRILSTGTDGCIILKAASDASVGAENIRITGLATHVFADGSMLPLTATARPLSEIMQDGGGRGLVPVTAHTVSISNPMEVRAVRLTTGEISIKPGTSHKIEIAVERTPGYKGNISFDALFQHLGIFGDSLPKGVTVDLANSKTILTGDDSAGHLTLIASADAPPVEKQLVPIMAHVTVNFTLKLTFCEPLLVTVLPAESK